MTPLVWDEIERFNENSALVKKHEKWGLIDRSGKVIVPPKWDWAGYFSEGFYSVDEVIINSTGERLATFDQWKTIDPFSQDGYAVVENHQGRWGIVDTKGKIIVEPLWDNSPSLFRGDVSVVSKDGKTGLVNKHGKLIVGLEWDRIVPDWGHNDLLPACKNGKWGFFNRAGESVSPNQWDEVGELKYNQRNVKVKKGRCWGLVDIQGNIVVEPKWDSITSIYPNIVDYVPGHEITWPNFYEVKLGSNIGVINGRGEIVIQPSSKWGKITGRRYDFTKERFEKFQPPKTYNTVSKTGEYGLLNASGQILIKPEWRGIDLIIITDQGRHWYIYRCTPKSSAAWVNTFYDTLDLINVWNAIPRPSDVDHHIVFDEGGKQIWQAKPYSPLIFIITTAVLIIMTGFLLLWLITYRLSILKQKR